MRTLGDMGVATFSVLSFLYSFANAILSGVAQGLQPLWGLAFGQKDRAELTRTLAAGLRINLISAAGIYVLLSVCRVPVVTLFKPRSGPGTDGVRRPCPCLRCRFCSWRST